MKILVFCITLLSIEVFAAEKGDSCVTPNKENATCTPIVECEIINKPVDEGNHWAIEFATESLCDETSEDTLVCCGTTGFSKKPHVDLKALLRAKKKPSKTANAEVISTVSFGELSDTTLCGEDILTANRIVGGTATQLGEFPWMAALEYKSKQGVNTEGIKCGGTLINSRYVLTAAHCIAHVEFELINAWLGVWNITSDLDCFHRPECVGLQDRVQKFTIQKKILHELFRKNGPHDIALLQSENENKFNDFVRPICLPSPDLKFPPNGSLMTVVGWGIFNNSDIQSKIKLKVEVPVRPNSACNEILKGKAGNITLTSNQLCAGGEIGEDACQGDSGGPLMTIYKVQNQFRWFQEGIVSFGIHVKCGLPGIPAVYTRVTNYIRWITNKIERNTLFIPDKITCGVVNEEYDEFPWIAAIETKSRLTNKTQLICGGSLINSRYVLTAAHCVENSDFTAINAWLGVWNVTAELNCTNLSECVALADRVKQFRIKEVIIHDYYGNTSNRHDIALLHSENEIKFNDYIRPICLDAPYTVGEIVTIAGWGFYNHSKLSDIKTAIEVQEEIYYECNEYLEDLNTSVSVIQICLLAAPDEDVCQGDAGGPVMKKQVVGDQVRWYQTGIVSGGVACGVEGIPSVYNRVIDYITWITHTIQRKEKEGLGISVTFANSLLPDRSVCGFENEKISGEIMTNVDEFPWMAALEYEVDGINVGIRCSGSVINTRYVLTTASCITDEEAFVPVSVRFGEWNTIENASCQYLLTNETQCVYPVEIVKIKRTIPHPFYSGFSNNIGLVHLEKDITYNDHIRPICLPQPESPSPEIGAVMKVAGIGTVEYKDIMAPLKPSRVTIKEDAIFLEDDECRDGVRVPNFENQLCLKCKEINNSWSTLQGSFVLKAYEDKMEKKIQWYQEGVVAFGSCGLETESFIYFQVSRYMNWIINVMSEE